MNAPALIPVTSQRVNESLIPTVNAYDLYTFLESKQKFTDWIKGRIEQFAFIEGEDYVVHKTMTQYNQVDRHIYFLSIDMAKELSMVERTAKGKQARQYFIECEKRALAPQHALPTYSEALRQLADKVDQLALQAPKVEAFNELMDSTDALSLQQVSKILGIGRTTLCRWLKAEKILMIDRLPYAEYAKHFKVVAGSWEDAQGETHPTTTTYVTPQGLDWIRKHRRGPSWYEFISRKSAPQ